ncbi:hypothetical protein Y900_011715 [Mycolicibacterium aromaticivorans JS19b1 = JCM 16368]|uniref:Haloalkane dehalogenase n=1 Tax=Mycolicibacterium aromaticivorans JS19b1 = JCM 16368 TaxID=1440774 RepID=A0A064CLJ2_9MYCO|nr:hypothetical protein Y900_011715 [Mycolicibacterium aromaticivorans JS19b1 = JCM 16368]
MAGRAGKVGVFTFIQTLRTPGERFAEIPNFPYAPHYCELDDDEGGRLRVVWIDEGPEHADPILLLHGEPTWSFPYRTMIPVLIARGIGSSVRTWRVSGVGPGTSSRRMRAGHIVRFLA